MSIHLCNSRTIFIGVYLFISICFYFLFIIFIIIFCLVLNGLLLLCHPFFFLFYFIYLYSLPFCGEGGVDFFPYFFSFLSPTERFGGYSDEPEFEKVQ